MLDVDSLICIQYVKPVCRTLVPELKDIPILGFLFGTSDVNETKTELMLFIIPHVISSPEDSDRVTKEFQNRLSRLNTSNFVEP